LNRILSIQTRLTIMTMLTMMRMMRILLGGFKGGNLYHNTLDMEATCCLVSFSRTTTGVTGRPGAGSGAESGTGTSSGRGFFLGRPHFLGGIKLTQLTKQKWGVSTIGNG
jgi:hypothetical protein